MTRAPRSEDHRCSHVHHPGETQPGKRLSQSEGISYSVTPLSFCPFCDNGGQFVVTGLARLLYAGFLLIFAVADKPELSIFRPVVAALGAATFQAEFGFHHVCM